MFNKQKTRKSANNLPRATASAGADGLRSLTARNKTLATNGLTSLSAAVMAPGRPAMTTHYEVR